MRILVITNMYPTAEFPGRGVFVQEQVKGLGAVGVEVQVVFVNRWREGPKAYYRLHHRVREAVMAFNPEAIHVMYGGVMADQIVSHHHLRPIVITFHGSDLLGEHLSGWIRRILSWYGVCCSRRAAREAEGVIVVARHLRDALRGAVAADKIRVIPCGIDLERFKPLETLACQRRLGWRPDSFHVLFASSNGDPVKQPWLAEAAVAHMSRGEHPPELHYLSAVPNEEVPVWLNGSDVLLLTSRHEGSPTVVKEALACRLPVVSVDVGDVAERIEGVDGCHLAQAEPGELALKLDLVRQHRRRLDGRTASAELSILSAAQKIRHFYQEITARNEPLGRPTSNGRLSIPVTFPAKGGRGFSKEAIRAPGSVAPCEPP